MFDPVCWRLTRSYKNALSIQGRSARVVQAIKFNRIQINQFLKNWRSSCEKVILHKWQSPISLFWSHYCCTEGEPKLPLPVGVAQDANFAAMIFRRIWISSFETVRGIRDLLLKNSQDRPCQTWALRGSFWLVKTQRVHWTTFSSFKKQMLLFQALVSQLKQCQQQFQLLYFHRRERESL